MTRKTLKIVCLTFLAIILILFALANKQEIVVSFDPLSTLLKEPPLLSMTMPLFVLLFVWVAIGILIGWCLGRFGRHKSS